MRAQIYQNLPFSFNEYLELPLFMMEQVMDIQKEISEERARQLNKIKGF